MTPARLRQASNSLWLLPPLVVATPLAYALAPDAAYVPPLLQAPPLQRRASCYRAAVLGLCCIAAPPTGDPPLQRRGHARRQSADFAAVIGAVIGAVI